MSRFKKHRIIFSCRKPFSSRRRVTIIFRVFFRRTTNLLQGRDGLLILATHFFFLRKDGSYSVFSLSRRKKNLALTQGQQPLTKRKKEKTHTPSSLAGRQSWRHPYQHLQTSCYTGTHSGSEAGISSKPAEHLVIKPYIRVSKLGTASADDEFSATCYADVSLRGCSLWQLVRSRTKTVPCTQRYKENLWFSGWAWYMHPYLPSSFFCGVFQKPSN
jgi:hypothetical protein